MGLLLEKRLCLSCHLDLELIVVLDDARQRGKALELEPEESPIRPKILRNIRLKGEENILQVVGQDDGQLGGDINHFSAER